MKAVWRLLGKDVFHEVGIALDYLTEFQNGTASDEDKKKYQAIEEAIAGMDFLYCELQGDVDEDDINIRELAEPYVTEEQCEGNIVEIVETLCDELAVYKRAIEVLENIPDWDGNWVVQKSIDQARIEIEKQKEDENA